MSEIHTRWVLRRDLPALLEIEHECYEWPWSEQEFITHLRHRNCIGLAAEQDGQVIGFLIYELHGHRIAILSVAVAPASRRQGAGTSLVDFVAKKIGEGQRDRVGLWVRESNLPTHLFLRSLGFRATRVARDFYRDSSNESAYLFELRRRTQGVVGTSNQPAGFRGA